MPRRQQRESAQRYNTSELYKPRVSMRRGRGPPPLHPPPSARPPPPSSRSRPPTHPPPSSRNPAHNVNSSKHSPPHSRGRGLLRCKNPNYQATVSTALQNEDIRTQNLQVDTFQMEVDAGDDEIPPISPSISTSSEEDSLPDPPSPCVSPAPGANQDPSDGASLSPASAASCSPCEGTTTSPAPEASHTPPDGAQSITNSPSSDPYPEKQPDLPHIEREVVDNPISPPEKNICVTNTIICTTDVTSSPARNPEESSNITLDVAATVTTPPPCIASGSSNNPTEAKPVSEIANNDQPSSTSDISLHSNTESKNKPEDVELETSESPDEK